MLKTLNKVLPAALLITMISSVSWAQQIITIKGKQVIANMGSNSLSVGDKVYAVSGGKRMALLKVTKVKGKNVLLMLEKGKIDKSMSIQPMGAAAASTPTAAPAPTPETAMAPTPAPRRAAPRSGKRNDLDADFGGSSRAMVAKPPMAWGLYLGYSMNSMKIKAAKLDSGTGLAYSEDLDLKGSSFSVKGMYDYPVSPDFYLRILAGYEPFEVTGQPATTSNNILCDNTANCSIKFQYLTGEVHGQYNLVSGSTRVWVGLGIALMFAPSVTSNVAGFDDSVKTNQIITGSLGADIGMGKSSFIPVAFEYGYYPTSGDVKASGMFFRVGYGSKL